MKIQKWTLGLAALGLVTIAPVVQAQSTPPPAEAAPAAGSLGTPLLTSLQSTTISGYVDTSAVWNPGTGTRNVAPYAFNTQSKQDGFNLDAVDIKLAKAAETDKWSAGYVAELNYGPDGTAIDGGAAPIRQAYVDLNVPIGNGLELKLGRWDALLGYESSDAMNNPNWTHSYAKFFEPTENTGLLTSYTFAEWLRVQVGVADQLTTYPGTVNSVYESRKAVTSLVTLIAPESWGALKGSSLDMGLAYGPGGGDDMTEWYIGTTIYTPLTGLSVGASFDCITDATAPGPGGGGIVDAGYFQSICGYLSYKIDDKSRISGRMEYADGGALTYAEAAVNPGVPIGTLNKVFELTGTYEYDLWANVMSRLEVRWDHNAGGTGPAFGGETTGVPVKNNAVLFAANVIYKF